MGRINRVHMVHTPSLAYALEAGSRKPAHSGGWQGHYTSAPTRTNIRPWNGPDVGRPECP